MPPLMQVGKILRAIEERVVTPVGGKPSRFTARLIAATHRDLIRSLSRTGGVSRGGPLLSTKRRADRVAAAARTA